LTTAIVIDDDIDTVEVLSEFLEIKDIQVVGQGYDGKQAVDLYQKHNPDLVFIDVMMPHYDGFYGVEKIKQLDPAAIVIVITGDLTTKTCDKLKLLNASLIIFKPFDIEKVMDIVKKLCKKKLSSLVTHEGRKCIC